MNFKKIFFQEILNGHLRKTLSIYATAVYLNIHLDTPGGRTFFVQNQYGERSHNAYRIFDIKYCDSL